MGAVTLPAEVRDGIRREVEAQLDTRMDDVGAALEALAESNDRIEKALAAIGPALVALNRSNAALARVLQARADR